MRWPKQPIYKSLFVRIWAFVGGFYCFNKNFISLLFSCVMMRSPIRNSLTEISNVSHMGKNRDTSGIFFPVSHRDTDLFETPNFSANSICVKPFRLAVFCKEATDFFLIHSCHPFQWEYSTGLHKCKGHKARIMINAKRTSPQKPKNRACR